MHTEMLTSLYFRFRLQAHQTTFVVPDVAAAPIKRSLLQFLSECKVIIYLITSNFFPHQSTH